MVAIVVVVSVTAMWEVALRYLGFVPEPRDSLAHWSLVRHEATQLEHPVVLVGSSQTAWGVHRATLERALGRPVLQLGLFQSAPAPIFRSLVDDRSLREATFVVEHNATLLVCARRYPHFVARARAAIADYEASTWATRAETTAGHALQRRFVSLAGRTGPLRALPRLLLLGEPPQPSATTRGFDRQLFHRARPGDPRPGVSSRSIEDVVRSRCPNRSLDGARAFLDDVRRARDAGHEVILTRLPVTGEFGQLERWLLEEQDRVFDAGPALVFDRSTEIESFELFEDTHLTGPASMAFTRELARAMLEASSRHDVNR